MQTTKISDTFRKKERIVREKKKERPGRAGWNDLFRFRPPYQGCF